jgi:hypothetical protein
MQPIAKPPMERLPKILILLLIAGIPAAAPPLFSPSPHLCFTAGSVTFQVLPRGRSDYRVKIVSGSANPDLRIQLVDRVDDADFAFVDDVGAAPAGNCSAAGTLKTVKVVEEGPFDVSVGLSAQAGDADAKLFVHSARLAHQHAAALIAAMRHYQEDTTTE